MSEQDIKPSTIIWFFIIAFIILFAGFGLRDPWPADEPRFVLVAKQMVDSGNWFIPHRGIEIYPDKPPVYFWLLSISYLVVGSWRWSFLLPSLISGMLVLFLVFDLSKRLWTPRSGLWAAIAVLATIHFTHQFKRAQIDPSLVLMTTASFYFIARHVLLGPAWGKLYAGFALAGLGVITKGVGFLPLLALLPLVYYRKQQFMPLFHVSKNDNWRWLLAFGFFLLPILLWLIPIIYIGLNSGNPEHVEYMQNILFKQTAERYADPWHHKQPFWYFAQTIAFFWLPFSLAWYWLLRPWRQAFVNRDLKTVFPLVWGIIVLLFFSVSAGKRDMYILPALPAFAIAAAPYLQSISERIEFRRLLYFFILFLSAGLLVLGLMALFGKLAFIQKIMNERGLGSEIMWLWWMLIVCGGIGLGFGLWAGIKRVLLPVALTFSLLWICYGFIVHPVLDASSSARAVMERARAQAGPGIEIGLVAWKEQNLLQAVGPVVEFGFLQPEQMQLKNAIEWMNMKPNSRRLMINHLAEFSCIEFTTPDAIDLEKSNRRAWWLVNSKAVAACNPAN